jgi:predicted dehydrogenase
MQEMKKQVESGVLGKLLHIEGNLSNENSRIAHMTWRLAPENSPGGSLTATGIHLLDAFVHLMGPVKRVQATYLSQAEPELQDSMAMILEFRSGATGVLSSVRPTPVFFRVHAYGTAGSAEARGPHGFELRIGGEKLRTMELEPLDALRAELEAFADAIRGIAPYPITPADMLATAETLEYAAKAVDTKLAVTLP